MSKKAYTHKAYENVKKAGRNAYVSQTSPETVPTECEVPAPVKYVVPIIFIPGIMGSNIKDLNKNKVWYPGLSTLIKYSKRDAAQRQTDLNPETTEVGYDGDIKLNKNKIPHITQAVAEARGWGSVITPGYSKVLIYLEEQLNQPFKQLLDQKEDEFKGTTEWEKVVQPGNNKTKKILENWSSTQITELLNLEQHEELADYAFPVFACGYNWLDSNMNSADKIAERLNTQVMTQVKNEFKEEKFKKFIIVTHSMGGLVTRALIQHPAVKDKIAGVVHGVMPASGAPAVYQRLTVGWDGWKASTGLMNRVKAWVTKFMFGDTSERLTATLASAPGGLELLPFANYSNHVDFPRNPKAWMILKAKTPTGEITASLPQTNDPYSEIYQRKDTWWAMMNPDFIDPAGLLAKEARKNDYESIFDVYRETLNVVKKLHEHIKDSYHPNTYAHYGADEGYKSFGQVVWRCKEELNINSEQQLIELMGLYGKKDLIKVPNTVKAKKQDAATDTQASTQFSKAAVARLSQSARVESDEDSEGDLVIDGTKTINLYDNAYKKDGVREVLLDQKTKISKTNKATFYLDIKPTSVGDGTVCYQSGQDVRGANRVIKESFIINGYEHASSYENNEVQLNTIYCIAKIVDILKKDESKC